MKPGEWFVLRTRTRQEKILARELNGVGITAYLLVIREARQYDRQTLDVEVPLFRRIVFVHGSRDDIGFAVKTGRVMSVARAADQVGLQADFALLAATLPTDAPAASEPDAPSRANPSPTHELHRDVIGRLRRELSAASEQQL